MSQTLTCAFSAISPARLMQARVNVIRRSERFEVLIDETSIDPAVLPPLEHQVQRVVTEFPAIMLPGVTPAVTFQVDELGGPAVDAELSPYLISVYVQTGTMPQDLADELAGGTAYVLSHL